MNRILAPPPPVIVGALGVLELGTNSLKLHLYSPRDERRATRRLEWEVGFEIYACGRLLESQVDRILEDVQRLLEGCGGVPEDLFGIATGAFREAEDHADLFSRLEAELSIPVRVLSGAEEARLLVRGFQRHVRRRPALLFDLGAGRLELVYLGQGGYFVHDTLPLGVIRLLQMGAFDSGDWQEATAERWIRATFRGALRLLALDVYGTGGTLKAIAQVAQTSELGRRTVDKLLHAVRTEGPPAALSPRRQAVFHPGLLLVSHLLDHVRADRLQFRPIGAGEVLMQNLHPFYRALGGRLRHAFIDRSLDIFT